jgi:hypothetical protein
MESFTGSLSLKKFSSIGYGEAHERIGHGATQEIQVTCAEIGVISMAPGLYFVRVEPAGRRILVHKVVVQE